MYGIKIELDAVNITDKVSRFEITAAADQYCRELSLELVDEELFDSLDFSTIPENPELEVFTKTSDTWYSQGQFFIERPTYNVGTHATTTGIWGRSTTAGHGSPFAAKITKTWTEDTTFFAVCAEVLGGVAGCSWDADYCEIPDFSILAYTFAAENLYPIEVITNLVGIVYGEDAWVTTDRLGHLCIRLRDRAPASADFSITDSVISALSEEPEWPDFGNRIHISPTGPAVGWHTKLYIPDRCLSANGTARAVMYVSVVDENDEPQNNIPVEWTLSRSLVTLDAAVTNTQSLTIVDEAQKAKSYYEVDVEFPPTTVVSVYSVRDLTRSTNLIADGYTLDGNTIVLPNKLTYCDQSLLITYTVAGVAVNYATAGTTSGTEKVTAGLSGITDVQELYIDNPCACPPRITLKANPSRINVGEVAQVLAYLEIAGSPVEDGRIVWLTIDSEPDHGQLDWTSASLGKVSVVNEITSVVNVIANVSQCELEMFADSVSSVYLCDENDQPYGSNLYVSHQGKTVTLSSVLSTDTRLIANYTAVGAVLNVYEGLTVGEDILRTFVNAEREERTEASCRITVTTPDNPSPDPPSCCDPGPTPVDPEDPEDPDNPYDPNPGAKCRKADNSIEICDDGEACCEKGGIRGCWPKDECDEPVGKCYSENCHETPDDSCFESRFGKALAAECSCEDICHNEFKKFGTTQSYDNGNYRTIEQIVVSDYQIPRKSPAFWEKYEQLKKEAIDKCRKECGDCELAPDLSVQGDDAIVSDGTFQYWAIGGKGPYTWAASGTGFSIDQKGLLTTSKTACGSGSVTVTDACGKTATKAIRVTDKGHWVH